MPWQAQDLNEGENMLRGLVTAVRTLTILPMPGKDAKDFSSSLYFFPFVGALLGLAVGAAVYLINAYTGWKELGAVVGILISARATGCLHSDGLADVCDSFGGSTRERRLAIMKDSSVGVYGVVGLIISLMLKYLCLMQLNSYELLIVVPVAFAISRTAQVGVMVRMPYARAQGTAGSFVQNAGLRHLAVAAVLALIFAWFMAWLTGMILAAVALLIVAVMRVWTRKAFGGVTGDVIGFTNELVEVATLVVAGVFLG